MPTSSPSAAASLIMEEIDARLTNAGTTARTEAHAHLPLQALLPVVAWQALQDQIVTCTLVRITAGIKAIVRSALETSQLVTAPLASLATSASTEPAKPIVRTKARVWRAKAAPNCAAARPSTPVAHVRLTGVTTVGMASASAAILWHPWWTSPVAAQMAESSPAVTRAIRMSTVQMASAL